MTIEVPLGQKFRQMELSPTLLINELVSEYWRKGETVYHMGFGESRFNVHPKLKQALVDNIHQKSYLPAQGLPSLRAQVADYYSDKMGSDIGAHQVIIAPGSKALIYAIQMLIDGDVFIPQPAWVSYMPQAELLGKKVFIIPAKPDSGFKFSIDDLDQQIKCSNSQHKLLILNSPNNPTGQMIAKDFLYEIANYCRNNNIWVLSDEIYFLVCNANSKHYSIHNFYPEGTFVLGGLSKHLSLGGWRLGIGILPKGEVGAEIMKVLVSIASEIWSAVPSPIQYAAIKAYEQDAEIESYIQTCAHIHSIRTGFLQRRLKALGVTCTEPEGAFYITINFDKWTDKCRNNNISTSVQLAEHLLTEYKIVTLPGSVFGLPSSQLSLRLATSYLDFEQEQDSERLLALYHSGVSEEIFMNKDNHPNFHEALSAFAKFVVSCS